MIRSSRTRAAWAAAGALLGVALAIPVFLVANPFDDAYIHARLAEHLLSDGQPFFNAGERFKAGSSTGYILLIAAASKPWGMLAGMRCLEALVIVATTVGVFYLASLSAASTLKSSIAAIAVLPYIVLAAYGGMETPVACLLMVGAAIASRHGKDAWVVLLLAFAAWFRFEAILLLAIVLYHYLFVSRIGKRILLYAAPLLVLFVFELAVFGTVVPYAARVKTVAYGFPLFASIFNVLSFGEGPRGLVLGLPLALVLEIHVAAILYKRLKIDIADGFLLFGAAVFTAWAIGRSLVFPWYYCLLVFPFGIAVLLADEPSLPKQWASVGRLVEFAKVAILVGFAILGSRDILLQFGFLGEQANRRVERYLDIGAGLYATCPSCTLVSSEIGALGYSFKGRVYDAFGVGDPAAAPFHPMKVPAERQAYAMGAIPPGYVRLRDPDFVVSMPVFSWAFRRSDLVKQYVVYDCPFGPEIGWVFGDEKIQVFSKRALPAGVLSSMGCADAR